MDTVIAMKEVRSGLSGIADRVASGESFVVMQNAQPVFRIMPLGEPLAPNARKAKLREIRERFTQMPVCPDELSVGDLDDAIRDARRNGKQEKTGR